MGFEEVTRYHVTCDKLLCKNLFYIIDLTDEDEDGNVYAWELESPAYNTALNFALYSANWRFIGDALYCPKCVPSEDDNLFAFLKADMGIA